MTFGRVGPVQRALPDAADPAQVIAHGLYLEFGDKCDVLFLCWSNRLGGVAVKAKNDRDTANPLQSHSTWVNPPNTS